MSTGNIDRAGAFLESARDAMGKHTVTGAIRAAVFTGMAAAIAHAELAVQTKQVAAKLDRIASVINQGKSWH